MAELKVPLLVEKSRPAPQSVQSAPPYLTRQPLYISNPTLFTAADWRYIAREPVTKLCIRLILREIGALEYDISSDTPEMDAERIKRCYQTMEQMDDGDGYDISVSRQLQDALILPMGGNCEFSYDDDGWVDGIWSVDSATLYPTYDRTFPFVQINPYNGLDRVYFGKGDLGRIILQPRVELDKKAYQEAPVESAFLGIEALSRIYLYNLKQLGDTPIAGILDLMDFSETEAVEWAKGFRELLEGIDPLKMPILYDHSKPARLLPLGRSPQDLNVVEQFKRFAEVVASAFGLSIGDLRLFEHERVLAGVEASQRITARSGVGYYAQTLEDFFNKGVFFSNYTSIRFKYKLGMTGEEQQQAQLGSTRATMLNAMIQGQYLKPEDAQAQAIVWKMIDVKPTGLPAGASGIGGLLGGEEGKPEEQKDEGQRVEDRIEDVVARIRAVKDPAAGVQFIRDLIGRKMGETPADKMAYTKEQIDALTEEPKEPLEQIQEAIADLRRIPKSERFDTIEKALGGKREEVKSPVVDQFVELLEDAFRRVGSRLQDEEIKGGIEGIVDKLRAQELLPEMEAEV